MGITYVEKQRAGTINPNKTCQPIGAMWATLGVHRGIPFVQGSQGCCTYVRYTFNRHFREPVSIAVASFHEDAAVYGGMNNLVEGLRNLVARYDPDLISVVTTCSSETIGDDVEAFIRAARKKIAKEFGEEKAQLPIIPVHCPSYQYSHVKGYDNASKAYMEYLAKKDEEKEPHKINIIPGFGVNPGDILEIKRILDMFGLKEGEDYSILFDISETLYQPLRERIKEVPYYPKGGTKVEEFVDAANGKATFALCKHAGGAGALYLQRKFKVPAFYGLPIGIKNTDDFVINIAKVTGLEIPDKLLDERGKLVDAIVDTIHYTMDKKVGIFGDPDFVIAVSRFACEIGMKPVVVNTQTPSSTYKKSMEEIANEHNVDIEVQFSDLWDFEKSVKKVGVDLLIGHPRGGVKIAEDMGIGLVRMGFPIYDRVGYFRWPIVGYMGSLRFFDDIVNTILDTKVPWDQKQQ
ncbi:nitrogenase component 1 [Methanotorris formicicus]|uniref:Oxidoreductase/nitrogenase component 1 n=1 Tax=Methanotorris formicicus Mc-S-70 TaxID=647171 RepID=H1L049_9EURY|nr:nitrogenase component 1 [Methanotorris formicicus]EHP85183.1 oxidoreductase/nitrogenase component 1 [Methanotorris formicicus Mc-S-70]